MKSGHLPIVIITISCLIFLDNIILSPFQTLISTSSGTFDYYDVHLHEVVESDRQIVERNIYHRKDSKQEIRDQVLGFDSNRDGSFSVELRRDDDKEVGDDDWSEESSATNHENNLRYDHDNFHSPDTFNKYDSSSIQNDRLFLRGQKNSQIVGQKKYVYYKEEEEEEEEDDDWIEQTEENMDEGNEGRTSSQDDDDGWIAESDLQFQ